MSKQAAKLRELNEAELQAKLRELERQLFTVRFAIATGQQDNTALLTRTKREIARAKTLWRERQLGLKRK